MSLPPYTVLPSKIGEYFKKIQEVGVPTSKVDIAWLRQLGYNSGNDNYLLNILKFLRFTDQTGIPTDVWKQYKIPTQSNSIMGEAIKTSYKELFALYPDAFRKDREALYAFFSSTGKAKRTIDSMVTTFQNLCKLATFEAVPVTKVPIVIEEGKTEPVIPKVATKVVAQKGFNEIHINIQLHLPETNDAKVYDSLFKSLRKHLLSDDEE